MGSSINTIVTGYVGADPQIRDAGQHRVASFSIAVGRKNGSGQESTLWVRVNCWNKLADVAEQYVRKGSLVQVTADWMKLSAWLDKAGQPQPSVDVDANRLVLLDRVEHGETVGSNGDIPF